MPSDVKCGLLVGIAGLVVVALLLFRKEEPVQIEPCVQSAAPAASRHEPGKVLISVKPISLMWPN